MRMLLVLAAITTMALPAAALERSGDGFFHTGDAVRVKKIAFVKIKVYSIEHAMKDLPAAKSKQAVIDADVDKRFSWKMLRTVEAEKIRNALREAYELNGYSDAGKIAAFTNALSAKELKEGDAVTIRYDAARKTTTISGPGGSASVSGEDFMKATWRIWFGKIDQPDLGDRLIDRF
jgi:hypothetical protein